MDHIGKGRPWDLDRSFTGGVQILQPYKGQFDTDWYAGTADAVAQNHQLSCVMVARNMYLSSLAITSMRWIMTYLIQFHRERGAEAHCLRDPRAD